MKPSLLLLCLLLFPLWLLAQRYYPTTLQSRETLSLSAGTTGFFGDLQGDNTVFGKRPHLGLAYEHRPFSRLGLRTAAHWYQLAARDADSRQAYLQERNLSFTSTNWELSVLAAVYALPYRPVYYRSRRRLNAYGLLGLGATYYNPKAELAGQQWALRVLETEGVSYSRVALVIPFGGGLTVKLSPQFDLALEATYHYAATDYLDDVSSRYQDPALFSDPIAAALADRRPELGLDPARSGSIRGNPTVKDGYSMLSLRLQYHVPRYHFRGRAVKKRFQR
ncbi:DUF6089 family protein [Cesiribacter andamanensis]|uniref:DUF6089 domain-containing protein n=1 Tax=Cesiribacter andamanensis AMV16 TaxID=1279009 RepID=M7P0L0_9BACT|nr:DUF6089 family protein [Cesiribacter andamanensis]EMR04134.1 hypothetical protein ADICEAN_00757 [Cesiribacter andamanensis AMV16]